ncbi:MAG: glycerophosphodiester phosphodiesterase [Chloroflexota bacterium]
MAPRKGLHAFGLAGRPRPLVMAHRGASGYAPENTLAAFRLALQQGTDLLETDLRFTRDGHLVCIHDATVDRTTDGHGPVSDMTLAEIRTLDAGSWFGDGFAGEWIPTLQELLAIIPEGVGLGLELKDPLFERAEYAQKLVDALPWGEFQGRVAILSFVQARMDAVKRVAPQIPAGLITLRRLLPFCRTELIGPVWPLVVLNPLFAWMAHRLNKFVCPLDDRPDSRVRWYIWIGCDAVLTNTPDSTIKAIKKATGGRWLPRSQGEK